tara:strand:- start:34263 stop:34481 length:219 start_codon:yes stop_codon:yes gene_type:complete
MGEIEKYILKTESCENFNNCTMFNLLKKPEVNFTIFKGVWLINMVNIIIKRSNIVLCGQKDLNMPNREYFRK